METLGCVSQTVLQGAWDAPGTLLRCPEPCPSKEAPAVICDVAETFLDCIDSIQPFASSGRDDLLSSQVCSTKNLMSFHISFCRVLLASDATLHAFTQQESSKILVFWEQGCPKSVLRNSKTFTYLGFTSPIEGVGNEDIREDDWFILTVGVVAPTPRQIINSKELCVIYL